MAQLRWQKPALMHHLTIVVSSATLAGGVSCPGEGCVGHICDLRFAELHWMVWRPGVQI